MTLVLVAIAFGSFLIPLVATCLFSRPQRIGRFCVDMKRLELATRTEAYRLGVSDDPAVAHSINAIRTFCDYSDRLSVWTLGYFIMARDQGQTTRHKWPEANSKAAEDLSELAVSALASRIAAYVFGETASGLILSVCMKMYPDGMTNKEINKIAVDSIEPVILTHDDPVSSRPLPLALAH